MIYMSYTEKFQNKANAARVRVGEVQPNEVDVLMETGVILLDIRDKEEFDVDHIPGAINISRGKLEMLIEEMVPDTTTPIVCYCNANNRGALSADTLRAMGYDDVKFIVGGLIAYRELH